MAFYIQNIDEIDSPALVVLPAQVRQNIAYAVNMVSDVVRLRPHVKTHKSSSATKLMLEAGVTKFKAATIAEIEMLGECGAKDVLLAYQPVGPKLHRLVAVVKKFPQTNFSCLVDHEAVALEMGKVFSENNLELPVYLDINIGQHRTGIFPERAFELYELCAHIKGVIPVGMHAYDGHIRDIDFDKRTKLCNAAFKRVSDLKEQIVTAGYDNPNIIAGGSPTFPIHAKRQDVECSPGTFIYWDKGYGDLCSEQPFSPAAFLVTRVISLPDATKICLDLGHKSVAAENEISKRVYFMDAPHLVPISQSEEHLVIEAGTNHDYKIGDVLIGIPYHICPTVALYEQVFIVENNIAKGHWKTTARDRILSQ
ncbi:MAG: D-TA family PLP-dependent enzyme [Bacteroidetes bacterium]|nr:D-TA family PLP-dependent enzyme [Bacteroidota bacterium]